MKIIFFSLGCLFLISTSLTGQSKINADKLKEIMRQDQATQLIDLRTPAEIEITGKIEGAKMMNYNASDFQARIKELNKEKPVIFYCAGGGRSNKAAAILAGRGYSKVYDYTGGMTDWLAKGLKTVK